MVTTVINLSMNEDLVAKLTPSNSCMLGYILAQLRIEPDMTMALMVQEAKILFATGYHLYAECDIITVLLYTALPLSQREFDIFVPNMDKYDQLDITSVAHVIANVLLFLQGQNLNLASLVFDDIRHHSNRRDMVKMAGNPTSVERRFVNNSLSPVFEIRNENVTVNVNTWRFGPRLRQVAANVDSPGKLKAVIATPFQQQAVLNGPVQKPEFEIMFCFLFQKDATIGFDRARFLKIEPQIALPALSALVDCNFHFIKILPPNLTVEVLIRSQKFKELSEWRPEEARLAYDVLQQQTQSTIFWRKIDAFFEDFNQETIVMLIQIHGAVSDGQSFRNLAGPVQWQRLMESAEKVNQENAINTLYMLNMFASFEQPTQQALKFILNLCRMVQPDDIAVTALNIYRIYADKKLRFDSRADFIYMDRKLVNDWCSQTLWMQLCVFQQNTEVKDAFSRHVQLQITMPQMEADLTQPSPTNLTFKALRLCSEHHFPKLNGHLVVSLVKRFKKLESAQQIGGFIEIIKVLCVQMQTAFYCTYFYQQTQAHCYDDSLDDEPVQVSQDIVDAAADCFVFQSVQQVPSPVLFGYLLRVMCRAQSNPAILTRLMHVILVANLEPQMWALLRTNFQCGIVQKYLGAPTNFEFPEGYLDAIGPQCNFSQAKKNVNLANVTAATIAITTGRVQLNLNWPRIQKRLPQDERDDLLLIVTVLNKQFQHSQMDPEVAVRQITESGVLQGEVVAAREVAKRAAEFWARE